MCLIAFDWRPGSATPLRLAANRDERHDRPAAPLARWRDCAEILGGRDLEAGGSWLAAHAAGRVAAITNVRAPGFKANASGPSRGHLVHQALICADLGAWLKWLANQAAQAYAGFNLLACDGETLWHLHHGPYGTRLSQVAPGLHGLSNASLDSPWPKLVQARQRLAGLLDDPGRPFLSDAWELLGDTRQADDENLPDTGVGLALERQLSAAFILGQNYGTRASTLLEWRAHGEIVIVERRFEPGGVTAGQQRCHLSVPPQSTTRRV
ncbi:NRDE family protein [Halomonas sp. HP20-15]|uniref:NRDE family protein n=1 Tax=Halomonas sp. HP20-15 TaxID=3085901 RepID=UPI002980E6B4|nr:NRDE family protein [Halomonas sp. HP20-15]MDW5377408.1 NRDE family protein [Halomonas sp. HP20-15]